MEQPKQRTGPHSPSRPASRLRNPSKSTLPTPPSNHVSSTPHTALHHKATNICFVTREAQGNEIETGSYWWSPTRHGIQAQAVKLLELTDLSTTNGQHCNRTSKAQARGRRRSCVTYPTLPTWPCPKTTLSASSFAARSGCRHLRRQPTTRHGRPCHAPFQRKTARSRAQVRTIAFKIGCSMHLSSVATLQFIANLVHPDGTTPTAQMAQMHGPCLLDDRRKKTPRPHGGDPTGYTTLRSVAHRESFVLWYENMFEICKLDHVSCQRRHRHTCSSFPSADETLQGFTEVCASSRQLLIRGQQI